MSFSGTALKSAVKDEHAGLGSYDKDRSTLQHVKSVYLERLRFASHKVRLQVYVSMNP